MDDGWNIWHSSSHLYTIISDTWSTWWRSSKLYIWLSQWYIWDHLPGITHRGNWSVWGPWISTWFDLLLHRLRCYEYNTWWPHIRRLDRQVPIRTKATEEDVGYFEWHVGWSGIPATGQCSWRHSVFPWQYSRDAWALRSDVHNGIISSHPAAPEQWWHCWIDSHASHSSDVRTFPVECTWCECEMVAPEQATLVKYGIVGSVPLWTMVIRQCGHLLNRYARALLL